MQEPVLITYGVNIMNNDLLIKWVLFLSTYHHVNGNFLIGQQINRLQLLLWQDKGRAHHESN